MSTIEKQKFGDLIPKETWSKAMEHPLFDNVVLALFLRHLWNEKYETATEATDALFAVHGPVVDYLKALELFTSPMPKEVGRCGTVLSSYMTKCMAFPENAGVVLTETLNRLRNLR
jgi:hypothetical protein